MIEVDEAIRDFSAYLTGAWSLVQRFAARATEETFVQDWQQASWESLVEASLHEGVLNVYNGGAEFYPDSSRVFRPATSDLPTHIIVCRPRDGGEGAVDVLTGSQIGFPSIGIPMEALVTASGRTFFEGPPFSHVLACREDERFVFAIDAIRFFVRPIEASEI